MNVILSIKLEYCKKIENGDKKYEFRKKIFRKRNNTVAKVYIPE